MTLLLLFHFHFIIWIWDRQDFGDVPIRRPCHGRCRRWQTRNSKDLKDIKNKVLPMPPPLPPLMSSQSCDQNEDVLCLCRKYIGKGVIVFGQATGDRWRLRSRQGPIRAPMNVSFQGSSSAAVAVEKISKTWRFVLWSLFLLLFLFLFHSARAEDSYKGFKVEEKRRICFFFCAFFLSWRFPPLGFKRKRSPSNREKSSYDPHHRFIPIDF